MPNIVTETTINSAQASRFLGFSKPFIDAIKAVFETMVYSSLQPGKPAFKKEESMFGDISVVMGLNGTVKTPEGTAPFKGMMIISFKEDVYVKVSNAMLSSNYKNYNDEIKDVGAEISNITTGNAKKILREMGYVIEMSIPSTVTGLNHRVQYPEKTQVILIPFDSLHGTFVMELCYQD